MKIWKRNAIIATVLLFVCAGIYLNWSYNNKQPAAAELTDTLDAEQVMGEGLVISDPSDAAVEEASAQAGAQMEDYFAQVRLSPHESRDSAVELLEQTIAYDEGTEVGTAATQTLNELVSTALSEAQIESLVIAKGYADCVTYIHDDTVCVAVAAPAEGLDQTDVALISDVVTAMAVMEQEGVCGLSTGIGSDIAEMLGMKSAAKGVRIVSDKEGRLFVECNVVANFGYSVFELAKNVQDAVRSSLESVTGLNVAKVNVNVCGIALPRESRK